MNIDIAIKQIILDSNKTINHFLKGGCYNFAKALKNIVRENSKIIYLIKEYHFVLDYNGKLYDASGNVTKKYKNSKYISENEFMDRKRLVKEFTLS